MPSRSLSVALSFIAIVLSGCPGSTNEPPSSTLTAGIECPQQAAEVGNTVNITATANRSTAGFTISANGGTVNDMGAGEATLSSQTPGTVVVTATATDGDESDSATCNVEFVPQGSVLSVDLACPSAPSIDAGPASVTAVANRDSSTLTFDFTIHNVDIDSTTMQQVLVNGDSAEITVAPTGAHTLAVEVSVTDNESTATDECSFTFTVPADALAPSPSARVPFQSACAQNVVNCTISYPTAVINVVAGSGQTVTETQNPPGFVIQGTDGNGLETVRLQGSQSELGVNATQLTYSWSTDATDDNPCTLEPGDEFSDETNPTVVMLAGMHLIRLDVVNEMIRDAQQSGVPECGTIPEGFKSDSLEIRIDIQD